MADNNLSASAVMTVTASGSIAVSGIEFGAPVTVPNDAYAAGWNSSPIVPTKDAVYDKIETLAPANATYITQTPSTPLTQEQALSLLATDLVKNTTTTGILSIATAGTDYVAPDPELTALSGTTAAPNRGIYFTDSTTASTFDLSSTGRAILDGATSAELRNLISDENGDAAALFSGAISPLFRTGIVFPSDAVDWTIKDFSPVTYMTFTPDDGGSININRPTTLQGTTIYRAGGTDVAIADGGTGASNAAGARHNLEFDSPVIRREPDGDIFLYGQDAANSTAVGTAIIAAQTAASSGDVIEVYANATITTSLGKSGVDWWFASVGVIGSGVPVWSDEDT